MLSIRCVGTLTKQTWSVKTISRLLSDVAKSTIGSINKNESNIKNQNKLLDTINNLNEWEPKYNHILNATQFLRLQQWKTDNGNFKSIEELVQLIGFDLESIGKFEELCDSSTSSIHPDSVLDQEISIGEWSYSQTDSAATPTKDEDSMYFISDPLSIPPPPPSPTESYEQLIFSESVENSFVEPVGDSFLDQIATKSNSLKLIIEPKRMIKARDISSFTTLYHDGNILAWTRFTRSNGNCWMNGVRCDKWQYAIIPPMNKEHVCNKVIGLLNIIDQIPKSDIFLLEGTKKIFGSNSMTAKKVNHALQMNQMDTIITTLLFNPTKNRDTLLSNVYFLGPTLAGRLFGLFIGSETASAEPVIKSILKSKSDIEVNDDLRRAFWKSNPCTRECLGRSMLIGLTFIILGLRK